MKNVLIIYTGGTIGMTRTENGYAPQSGQFRRAMEAIPDLYAEQMPRWDMLEMAPLLDERQKAVAQEFLEKQLSRKMPPPPKEGKAN